MAGESAIAFNAANFVIPLQQAYVEFVGVKSRPLNQMLDELAERVAKLATEDGA